MEPNRYVLKGRSLARLGAQALAEHGPQARIVSAERILQGGIGGFMAREHFEAVVEVPRDPRHTVITATATATASAPASVPAPPTGPAPAPAPPAAPGPATVPASGSDVTEAGPAEAWPPSTAAADESPAVDSRRRRRALEQHRRRSVQGHQPQEEDLDEGFARMMDELWLASRQNSSRGATPTSSWTAVPLQSSAPIPAPPGQAPLPLRAPGSLIVIACLGVDPAEALASFAATADFGTLGDPLLVDGHDLAGRSLREARQAVLGARAQAVATQVPVLATTTLRFPGGAEPREVTPPLVTESDQLWAAVDLRRKPEDLRHWLGLVDRSRPIDGLLLTGAQETLSPETGHQLGWPVSGRLKQC